MPNDSPLVGIIEDLVDAKPGDYPIKASLARLDVSINVNAQVQHVTPQAAKAAEAVAIAQFVTPVRVVMRYFIFAVLAVLVFLIVVALLTKLIDLPPAVAIALAVVAGASVAAPLGILVSKVANRILQHAAGPTLKMPGDDKDEQGA